jgi:type II secretion system protein J
MTLARQKASAFTLLEVLVATMLIAILAGSLYASLSIAFKARRSAMEAVAPTRKVGLTMELLSQDLRSAMVPNGRMAGAFFGSDDQDGHGRDSDSLEFFCTPPSPEPKEGVGDIKKINIQCEPSEDGASQVLVRLITTNLLTTQDVTPQREVLCRGVFAFNLRYFNGTDWLDTWDSTTVGNLLPRAIEVTLQLANEPPNDTNVGGYLTSQVFVFPCSVITTGTITITSSSSRTSGSTGSTKGATKSSP